MRFTAERKSDAIEKLGKDQGIWVSTADERGIAHLVPVSLCWHDGIVVVAVEALSRTARNASASGQARLALGPSDKPVPFRMTVRPAISSTSRHT